jgi:hypothetical protein
VPSLGPHSPCEGDNQAVVRFLDARPRNVAAWLGLVALSYQTPSFLAPFLQDPQPHMGSLVSVLSLG